MATVAPDVDRLRRLADRVQASHAWLWEGGTQLSVLNHRMECCDEDHQGCAHVGLVEMSRAIADNYAELLAAAKLAELHFQRNHASGEFQGDDEHEAWWTLRVAIAKAEGR